MAGKSFFRKFVPFSYCLGKENHVIPCMDRPTDWVNILVIAKKKDGNLRLCLDTRDLNKVMKREHYRIPTAEDTALKLAGNSVFSILGEEDGFWRILFGEDNSLCNFNSPFGRYRFLGFGIISVLEA